MIFMGEFDANLMSSINRTAPLVSVPPWSAVKITVKCCKLLAASSAAGVKLMALTAIGTASKSELLLSFKTRSKSLLSIYFTMM